MADSKVDLEAGGPNLLVDLVAEALHEGGDGILERRVRVFGRGDALLQFARLGVLEKPLEDARPLSFARSRSMWPAANETKISHRLRARVKSTLRRRSPPSAETGPKAMLSRRDPATRGRARTTTRRSFRSVWLNSPAASR